MAQPVRSEHTKTETADDCSPAVSVLNHHPAAYAARLAPLRHQPRDDAAFAEELDWAAGRGVQLLVRVEAQQGEQRRGDIVRRARVDRRGHALAVGLAVAVATLEAA